MKKLSAIMLALPLVSLYGMERTPFFIAQIYNESKKLFLMGGYTQDTDNQLQVDDLARGEKISFRVTDNKPVKVGTPTGVYQISLHSYYTASGDPIHSHAIFEKLQDDRVLLFRKFFAINPFSEFLDFRILLDNSMVLLTAKEPVPEGIAMRRPAEAFTPPFTS